MATPSTPPRKRIDRDTRIRILTLRDVGWKYAQIATHLKVTERAVSYTCQTRKVTPQHSKAGRPPKLSKDEVDKLVQYVISSKETRRMSYLRIAENLWPEGEVGPEPTPSATMLVNFFSRSPSRSKSSSVWSGSFASAQGTTP
jgi:Homeodomain-like domain